MVDRDLLAPAFPDDTGEVDPAVAAALAAASDGTGSQAEALAAIQESRILVPVVAVLGETEIGEAGIVQDKSSDLAAVLLRGADGRMALLGFTGSGPMTAWNPEARPVPVTARTAALAAVQEGAAALVVDIAGPAPLVIADESLRALASGWTVAPVDGELAWVRPA